MCFLVKEEVAKAVKKELKFSPGREVIICFQWLCLLAPVIVLARSELGDKIPEKLSGVFQDNWGRGRGGGRSLPGFPTVYRTHP